jgi:hypothetical protein
LAAQLDPQILDLAGPPNIFNFVFFAFLDFFLFSYLIFFTYGKEEIN